MQVLIGLRNINYGGVDTQVYARDFMRIINQNYSFIDIFRDFLKILDSIYLLSYFHYFHQI